MTAYSDSHKFVVGESVHLSVPSLGLSADCKVVRLLPKEAGENQYRVRSESEAWERVVREGQLRSTSLGSRAAAAGWGKLGW